MDFGVDLLSDASVGRAKPRVGVDACTAMSERTGLAKYAGRLCEPMMVRIGLKVKDKGLLERWTGTMVEKLHVLTLAGVSGSQPSPPLTVAGYSGVFVPCEPNLV